MVWVVHIAREPVLSLRRVSGWWWWLDMIMFLLVLFNTLWNSKDWGSYDTYGVL